MAAVAAAGGGWLVWTQVLGDGGGPEQAIRGFVRAIDDGDAAAANEYVHPESPQGHVTQGELDRYAGATLEIRELSVISQTDDRATVQVRVYDSVYGGERSLTYNLRRRNGEWLLYSQGSGGGSQVDTPQVSFDFEFDPNAADNAGILTITHHGGDTVQAGALHVRGTGFAGGLVADADADLRSAGSWADGDGDVTQVYDASTEVTAGDRIAVAVTSAYEIDVVWESPEGDTSSTLASDSGPDA